MDNVKLPRAAFLLFAFLLTTNRVSARSFATLSTKVRNEGLLPLISKNFRGGGEPFLSGSKANDQHFLTLGDLEELSNVPNPDNSLQQLQRPSHGTRIVEFQSLQLPRGKRRPPPITELFHDFSVELHNFSPTLFFGTATSLFIFVLWQFPDSSPLFRILQRHFVCSRSNVIRGRRFHAALLSAFSHASVHHIAVNLYAFLKFGPSVKQVLASQGLPLWSFVISSALFGSLSFLVLEQRKSASCIGLSGVTLALLSFDALMFPFKELRLFVYFISIKLPAYYLFLGLLCFSALGALGLGGHGSKVAHTTHLGGLIFGTVFHKVFFSDLMRQLTKSAVFFWEP